MEEKKLEFVKIMSGVLLRKINSNHWMLKKSYGREPYYKESCLVYEISFQQIKFWLNLLNFKMKLKKTKIRIRLLHLKL